MNRFIILYDLRKKNKDNYPKLYRWFEENKTIPLNESTYIARTEKDIDTVSKELLSLVDKDDDLVINIFPKGAIALNSNKNEWFDKH